jgi:hypothetical protein
LLTGRPTVFDTLYALLITHWVTYLLGIPFLVYLAFTQGPLVVAVLLTTRWLAFYLLLAVASAQLRHFHLILFAPVLVAIDLVFRVIWIHAVIKTLRQPTVEACKWDSPARVAS